MNQPDSGELFARSFRPTSNVHSVEVDGETVVYDETTGSLHLLDSTATVIWSRLAAATSLGSICDELAAIYHSEPAIIRRDVAVLIAKLKDSGLITDTDTAAVAG